MLCASSKTTRNHSTPPIAPPHAAEASTPLTVDVNPPLRSLATDGALTTCAPPSPPAPAPPRPGVATSIPTTAKVVSTTSYSVKSTDDLVRPTPWCTNTLSPAAGVSLEASSRCHCRRTLVGHTTRVPPTGRARGSARLACAMRGGGGLEAMRAMVENVLPRPWSSAKRPPWGVEPGASRRFIHESARRWWRSSGMARTPSGMSTTSSSAEPARPSRTPLIAAALSSSDSGRTPSAATAPTGSAASAASAAPAALAGSIGSEGSMECASPAGSAGSAGSGVEGLAVASERPSEGSR
mmetsp:Transcript_19505/g.48231  ORF Transcript_19505/g.48231 Transcript_19505/m.48231 type:complete len:296 (-) Transcript_19505:60-947(-)